MISDELEAPAKNVPEIHEPHKIDGTQSDQSVMDATDQFPKRLFPGKSSESNHPQGQQDNYDGQSWNEFPQRQVASI